MTEEEEDMASELFEEIRAVLRKYVDLKRQSFEEWKAEPYRDPRVYGLEHIMVDETLLIFVVDHFKSFKARDELHDLVDRVWDELTPDLE